MNVQTLSHLRSTLPSNGSSSVIQTPKKPPKYSLADIEYSISTLPFKLDLTGAALITFLIKSKIVVKSNGFKLFGGGGGGRSPTSRSSFNSSNGSSNESHYRLAPLGSLGTERGAHVNITPLPPPPSSSSIPNEQSIALAPIVEIQTSKPITVNKPKQLPSQTEPMHMKFDALLTGGRSTSTSPSVRGTSTNKPTTKNGVTLSFEHRLDLLESENVALNKINDVESENKNMGKGGTEHFLSKTIIPSQSSPSTNQELPQTPPSNLLQKISKAVIAIVLLPFTLLKVLCLNVGFIMSLLIPPSIAFYYLNVHLPKLLDELAITKTNTKTIMSIPKDDDIQSRLYAYLNTLNSNLSKLNLTSLNVYIGVGDSDEDVNTMTEMDMENAAYLAVGIVTVAGVGLILWFGGGLNWNAASKSKSVSGKQVEYEDENDGKNNALNTSNAVTNIPFARRKSMVGWDASRLKNGKMEHIAENGRSMKSNVGRR